ncbi:MAG: M48 family metallopeptidase, partial [Thermoanaerobaculia bacterium]
MQPLGTRMPRRRGFGGGRLIIAAIVAIASIITYYSAREYNPITPGGQVFVTAGLVKRLQTEGQLAGVLGHEIGHVVARHGAEHIAKAQLTQGLTGAAVLATYDPDNPDSRSSAAVAALIGNLVNMRFGRNDELESDKLGVRFTADAGYDPRAMVEVMRILAASAGGPRPPEFFSTHPNPDRRVERIQAAIADRFP